MKSLITILLFSFSVLTAKAQTKDSTRATPDPTKKVQIVEASCGQCKLGLPGKSCDLAVRIDGKAYFVDGTTIDEHGDAHAKDGFCEAIKTAEVQGEIKDDRFKVTYYKLVKTEVRPEGKPEKKKG